MPSKNKKIYNPSWSNYFEMWGNTECPWRPSKKDISFCEEMIKMVLKKEKNPKALIFGSTPEIRDLLAKYKIEATIIDANPTMKKAMDKLMKRKVKNEKLVINNWLDVKLQKNYFDLAFGDGILCNISLNTWKTLIDNLNSSLKEHGLFYLAAWVYQVKKPWSYKDLIKKYKKNPKYFNDFKNRIWSLHRLYLEPGLYNKRRKEFDFFKTMKGLEKFIKKGIINKTDFKNLQWVDYDLGEYIEVAFNSIKENDNFLRRFYKIVDMYTDKTHPITAFRRDYILKKK